MICPLRRMFSRPVRLRSKPALSSSRALTLPLMTISPSVGNETPVIILRTVDLPAPFAPKSATRSPLRMVKLRSLLAWMCL